MKKPDFKNSLVRARNSIKESQDVRSMYNDDAVNEDIAGLSDLIGIVKGFAPNWQAIASAVILERMPVRFAGTRIIRRIAW